MPNCLSCGRELPSPNEPHNICPECRTAILQHAKSQAPIRSRISPMRRIPVTTAIIAVNVLVFVAMVLSGLSPLDPGNAGLMKWGANNGLHTLLVQPWRMLASNYVHIGIIHIALNMWCLWNLGILAEQIFDRWSYLVVYTFCGLAGSLLSIALHPIRVSAGASGAVFGLAGALISALYLGHLPIHPGALKATLKSLLSFAGYNLFFGAVVPAIDNSAHIGGLVTGLALGALLAPHLTSPREERSRWNRVIFLFAACVFVGAFYLARHYAPELFLRQIHAPVSH
jgi:membrane associated rhomboid family serine protease